MNRVVLVTGASRGIGAAVARKAASEGYAVGVNYLHDAASAAAVVASIQNAGGNACAIQGDVANSADVAHMFETVEASLGTLHAVVNNAGITGRLGPFSEARPEAIEAIFRTNVLGLMECCRVALECFRRSGTKGVIVNVSSVASTTGSPNEYVHYAASKAAVETFTTGLARELAAEGIRVCGVAPGSTLTDIHASAGEPDRPLRIAPKIPLGRLAEPEEIAEPIVWLLTPAASYITGTTIRCTGGL